MKRTTKQQFKPVKAWALIYDQNIGECGAFCPGDFCHSLAIYRSKLDATLMSRHHKDVHIVPVIISPLPARGKTNPSKKKK